MDSSELPSVTVIIPMFNEERHIAYCLESILSNDYPQDKLQILVVDGLSSDRSVDLVNQFRARYPIIDIISNPKRTQAAALNIGLRHAKGAVTIRMDAHTIYSPDYIRACVELLCSTGAAAVGGPQVAIGESYIGNVVATALNHPFGVGDARFRFADADSWVDTVYLGAWWTSTLKVLGGFDEEWVVNEDYELNYRLRLSGGKILVSPRVRCQYVARGSIGGLARQYFRYGFWRVKTLVRYPESLRWRQVVAPIFVMAMACSMVLALVEPYLGLLLPLVYGLVSLAMSIHAGFRRGWVYVPLLPVVFAVMHVSWGLGFIAGLVRWGVPRVSLRILLRALQSPYKGRQEM